MSCTARGRFHLEVAAIQMTAVSCERMNNSMYKRRVAPERYGLSLAVPDLYCYRPTSINETHLLHIPTHLPIHLITGDSHQLPYNLLHPQKEAARYNAATSYVCSRQA